MPSAQPSSQLLARLLDTPNLVSVVRSLEPIVLHRLVRGVGLEECGAIVALASPEQLMRVFDLDLWRNSAPGDDQQFDADRFGLWIEVLVDADVRVAAEKLMGLDFDFVTAAMTRHLRVIDSTSRRRHGHDRSYDLTGYTILARRNESWDALLAVLAHLDAEHHDFFRRLISRCHRISIDYREEHDGLDDLMDPADQILADVAFDRDQRRERQGYVTTPQAVAFLTEARQLRFDRDAAPRRDYVTSSYFREMDRQPVPDGQSRTGQPQQDITGFVDTLREAGILPDGPRGLLTGDVAAEGVRLSRIRDYMTSVCELDEAACARAHEELGYLANVLVAGGSVDSRQFTGAEAYDAVMAACNLGLENWPRQWPSDEGVRDLVAIFRVGWAVIYEQVGQFVPRRASEILLELSCDDPGLQDDIRGLGFRLRRDVAAGVPWRGRDHLDAIAILDTPSWALLVRLIDECPSVPANLDLSTGRLRGYRVTSEFEFISDNRQIAWARNFVESLPDSLVE